MILYRPTGLEELALIYESGMTRFPPRLPEQPIFYPVLNRTYAQEIASKWNTTSHSFAGYVTQFSVDDAYLAHYPRHRVGSHIHEELWIPAEELEQFNDHILARIKITDAFFGADFRGRIPSTGLFQGLDAFNQFSQLVQWWKNDPSQLEQAILTEQQVIYLHYPFWSTHDFKEMIIPEEQKALCIVVKLR
jgi:hypothetical protein